MTETPAREPTTFSAADGTALAGIRIGGREPVLVLVHELGRDLDAWGPAPEWLAREGFGILLLELRGHGASDGEVSPADVAVDVEAAIASARSGDSAAIVVAAGDAADGAIAAARRTGAEGLVLVSPELTAERPLDAERVFLPSLAILDQASEAVAPELVRVQSRLSGWRMTVHAGTGDRGSALLSGEWAGHAHEHIRSFARQTVRSRAG